MSETIRAQLVEALVSKTTVKVYYGGGDVAGEFTGEMYSLTPKLAKFLDGPSITISAIKRVEYTPDVATERWHFNLLADRITLCDGELGQYLVQRDNRNFCASDEQMQVMAAAPEMLEALEEVFACMYDVKLSTAELSGKIQTIISKARGEDG